MRIGRGNNAQRQRVALHFRVNERRHNAIDPVAGLIGLGVVREVRVYGGILFADATAVELEAVGVDGCAIGVLVVSLHGGLEEELGRGRAAFIVRLAHGSTCRQVDLRRAGDGYRIVEGHGHVDHVVQFVGAVSVVPLTELDHAPFPSSFSACTRIW